MASQFPAPREELICLFWREVRDRLINNHHKKPDEADLGIGRYRGETERRELGDVVYNRGSEQTAEIVNGIIENGLPRVRRTKAKSA